MQKLSQTDNIEQELSEAVAVCFEALAGQELGGLIAQIPGAHISAQEWFDLLYGFPHNDASANVFRQLREAADAIGASQARPEIERYAVLQALTVALPQVNRLPLAGSVKRGYVTLAEQAAHPSAQWRRNFAAARPPFMGPMAALVTLRQFPAGELLFNYEARMSIAWPLRFPPLAIPGFLYELAFSLKGLGPVICPHINRWRPNPLILQKEEVERSFWRMAKTLELRPDIKFLMADSWLHSAETVKFSPHLAWMRALYEDAGAYIVDMESANEDAGFRENNRKRREMHQTGSFHPRRTLALWGRDNMLAWAAARTDLIDEGETGCRPPARIARSRAHSPKPARGGKYNSKFHLWDGMELLSRNPAKYVLLVLALPALVAGIAASAVTWWAGPPIFLVSLIFAWVFQYYAFQ